MHAYSVLGPSDGQDFTPGLLSMPVGSEGVPILPSTACADAWLSCPVAHNIFSLRSDSDGLPTLLRTWICLGAVRGFRSPNRGRMAAAAPRYRVSGGPCLSLSVSMAGDLGRLSVLNRMGWCDNGKERVPVPSSVV